MASVTAPLYILKASPARIRGSLVSTNGKWYLTLDACRSSGSSYHSVCFKADTSEPPRYLFIKGTRQMMSIYKSSAALRYMPCSRSFSSSISSFREETDYFGSIQIPSDKLWGAKTQRLLQKSNIGGEHEQMPAAIIQSFGILKKCAAKVNMSYGLNPTKCKAIMEAAQEVADGKLNDHFPLAIWQTGRRTPTNINVNEVIANRAVEILGYKRGEKVVDPNDHVNHGQYSHDTFRTAMHIAAAVEMNSRFIPSLKQLHSSLNSQSIEIRGIVGDGEYRNIEQSPPMKLYEKFSGYANQVKFGIDRVTSILPRVFQLTQVDTAPKYKAKPTYGVRFAVALANETNLPFVMAGNKFEAMAADDAFVELSGTLNMVSASLMTIANDIGFVLSDPRNMELGELFKPANGSWDNSLPLGVDPTECETLAMVCAQVMGNHVAITVGRSYGLSDVNVYKPVIASCLLRSLRLLGDASAVFEKNYVRRFQEIFYNATYRDLPDPEAFRANFTQYCAEMCTEH